MVASHITRSFTCHYSIDSPVESLFFDGYSLIVDMCTIRENSTMIDIFSRIYMLLLLYFMMKMYAPF